MRREIPVPSCPPPTVCHWCFCIISCSIEKAVGQTGISFYVHCVYLRTQWQLQCWDFQQINWNPFTFSVPCSNTAAVCVQYSQCACTGYLASGWSLKFITFDSFIATSVCLFVSLYLPARHHASFFSLFKESLTKWFKLP